MHARELRVIITSKDECSQIVRPERRAVARIIGAGQLRDAQKKTLRLKL
jgi:hypothetical protein